MLFVISFPGFPSQPLFYSSLRELQLWRRSRLEDTYDDTVLLLFSVARDLTGNETVAEDLVARTFAELFGEKSMLTEKMPARRAWVLRRIIRHCRIEIASRFSGAELFPSMLEQTAAKDFSPGRALFEILLRIRKSSTLANGHRRGPM